MADVYDESYDTGSTGDGELPVSNATTDTAAAPATPEQTEADKALVQKILKTVKADKRHFKKAFERMKRSMFMAQHGRAMDWSEKSYKANIVGRHINQKTAAIYAKNPKVVARRKEMLDFTVWDETPESLMTAMQILKAASGERPPPPPPDPAMVKVEGELAIAKAKAESEIAARNAKTELDQMVATEKLRAEQAATAEKLRADQTAADEKLRADQEAHGSRMAAEAQATRLAEQKHAQEQAVAADSANRAAQQEQEKHAQERTHAENNASHAAQIAQEKHDHEMKIAREKQAAESAATAASAGPSTSKTKGGSAAPTPAPAPAPAPAQTDPRLIQVIAAATDRLAGAIQQQGEDFKAGMDSVAALAETLGAEQEIVRDDSGRASGVRRKQQEIDQGEQ